MFGHILFNTQIMLHLVSWITFENNKLQHIYTNNVEILKRILAEPQVISKVPLERIFYQMI